MDVALEVREEEFSIPKDSLQNEDHEIPEIVPNISVFVRAAKDPFDNGKDN